MYCLDNAERPQPGNQLFFMLHELVFLGYHSQYSYSCKISQPYIVATARMYSDAVFSYIGTARMKTFIKNYCS